jgi:hypothetical protein
VLTTLEQAHCTVHVGRREIFPSGRRRAEPGLKQEKPSLVGDGFSMAL